MTISDHLNRIRTAALKSDLVTLGWMAYSGFLVVFTVLIFLEMVFYFPPSFRSGIWVAGIEFGIFSILALGILTILAKRNILPRYRLSTLARRVGHLAFTKEDSVVNALQLERSFSGSASPELSTTFISQVIDKLSQLDLKTLFPQRITRRWKAITFLLLGLTAGILIGTWRLSTDALYRWSHPGTAYTVPVPFELKSITGNVSLLGGESTSIIIQAAPGRPDSVTLELIPIQFSETGSPSTWTDSSGFRLIVEADSAHQYRFQLDNIYRDYLYQARVPARHFWQAWKEVRSAEYRIFVTDRPTLEQFTITVISPAYSKLLAQSQEGNQANVQGLKGSSIAIQLTSNRPLAKSFIRLDGKDIPLTSRGKRARGEFLLLKDGIFTVHLLDSRGITNWDPIQYHLQIIPDLKPELNVLAPPPIVELGGDQLIPIQLSIEDDFGFSALQTVYEIHRPSYVMAEPFISMFVIPGLDKDILSQEIQTIWDVSDLGLMPDDEIHYHFELYDNDDVSGPKKSLSDTFIARVPSLEDLYTALEENESSLMETVDTDLEELQALQKHLEKMELDILKIDELEWDQQQELKEILEEVAREVNHLEEISKAVEAITEAGEKNNLFSPELLKKFNELQELVQELISQDLLQSMDNLAEALENMNPEDIRAAMEDLSRNMDRMEAELDRFIDIFKRIQAEQKMDEVLQRLEQLTEQQESLNREIENTPEEADPSTFARLSQEEEWNREEFNNIREVMKEAAEHMDSYSPTASESMADLESSPLIRETRSDLKQTVNQLQKQDLNKALQSGESAHKNLQDMQAAARNIQSQFQQETVAQMVAQFQAVMRDVLTLSKHQESLGETSARTPRNSPRLRDQAGEQQMLKDQLSQIMAALMDLSKETFLVTPEMGKAMGMANAQMEAAKNQLADRNTTAAKASQETAMKSLNEAAKAIYQSMQSMEASGSASGFEQFLQRMQEMSGQQQGINNQGMQLALGQMAASAQQALMQRLLQEQRRVRKSLRELMQEMRSSGNQGLGDLESIAREMDEVIKELQSRQYTRKTQERHQRILTRMLDSQRSMTERGYKEERISRSAPVVSFSGPSGLPQDLGQRRNLALEALNRAMKSGYSRDYQTMIRRYFNSLSQTEIEPRETPRD